MVDVEKDWRSLQDTATRRRIQNRIAQRKYRSNIRNRLKELEDRISLKPTATRQSIDNSRNILTERHENLDDDSGGTSLSITGGTNYERLHSKADAGLGENAINGDYQLSRSLMNSFDLSNELFSPSEEMTPAEATSLPNPHTFSGLPTPSDTFDYNDISTLWSDVSVAQETGNKDCNKVDCEDRYRLPDDCRRTDVGVTRTLSLSGFTTLHLAAQKGHREIVELLLDHGCNVNDTDLSGQSALHIAAASGYQDVAHLLIRRGAAVALKDARGQTALHLAAENGHLETAKPLLQLSSPKEINDSSGNTPLHIAIEQGHGEIVRLLLDHGADPTARVSP